MWTGLDIKRAREAKGLSQRQLAEAVSISQPAIRHIESGLSVKSKHLPDVLRVLGLAELVPVSYANVRGMVAAGAWMEHDTLIQSEFEPVPRVPGRYDTLEQYAFLVSGNSVDKAKLLDGDYAICVNYWEARSAITDGDLVVIERRRAGAVERTCKKVKITPEGYELWPKSSNPLWQNPIVVKRDQAPEDGVEIEIVGLVVARFSYL